jgi:hypothetical protein
VEVEVEAEVAQPKAGNRLGSFGVIQGGDDQDIHKKHGRQRQNWM